MHFPNVSVKQFISSTPPLDRASSAIIAPMLARPDVSDRVAHQRGRFVPRREEPSVQPVLSRPREAQHGYRRLLIRGIGGTPPHGSMSRPVERDSGDSLSMCSVQWELREASTNRGARRIRCRCLLPSVVSEVTKSRSHKENDDVENPSDRLRPPHVTGTGTPTMLRSMRSWTVASGGRHKAVRFLGAVAQGPEVLMA